MIIINKTESIEKIEEIEEQKVSFQRVPRIKLINLKKNLQELIESIDMIPNPRCVIFTGNQKGSNRANASIKMTSFIGVSKNGPNWQSLITINKKKTYVGTYMTEIKAAKAYDFYWMVTRWMRAQTNFTYTKEGVHRLIKEFIYLIH